MYIKKCEHDRSSLSSSLCIVSITWFWNLFLDFLKFIYQFPNFKRRAHSVAPFCIHWMGCRTSKFRQEVVFRRPLNYCKGFLVIHCLLTPTAISRKTCFRNFKSHFLKIAFFDISTLNSCQMVIFAPRNFVLVSFERLSCL